MKSTLSRSVMLCFPALLLSGAQPPAQSGTIQSLTLDPSRPLFVPTHPRVSTTVRFPSPLGPPEGRGFTEDNAKQSGEYLVSWTRGDSHFTIAPLENAGPLNLNVPYRGNTYVFYFYPADNQFQALASLNCLEAQGAASQVPAATGPGTAGNGPPEMSERALLSPARALGLIDRLKIVHSSAKAHIAERAFQLGLELASSPLCGVEKPSTGKETMLIESPQQNCGLFDMELCFIARDSRLCGVAFCLLLRNKTPQPLAFDVASFGARQGPLYFGQFVSDAPGILLPGEQREAFFAISTPSSQKLSLSGLWRISVALISPSLSPGSVLVQEFAGLPPPQPLQSKTR